MGEQEAKAAYAVFKSKAAKYYPDQEDLKRYKPWEDLSQEWRNDFTEAIDVAAVPAIEAMRLKTIDECEAVARDYAENGDVAALDIAEDIAALKDAKP